VPRSANDAVLRPANDADVEMIRAWRNHPQVRRASIMTAEITPDMHRDWWARVGTGPESRVLLFWYRGEPAGVVIFKDLEPVAGRAEWGFFLDVDRLRPAGRLFAAWIALERAAVAYAFEVLGLTVLGGRTLAWNTAVLELHRRHGFVEVPQRRYTTVIDGVAQDVVWTERRAQT
jgi:RimJ/RimL family protein N-acetyltransferase